MGQSASVGQGTVGADELKVTGNGSSGQVLSSDGDGTFSWVTDSEEYLPLAGGTLTGSVTGMTGLTGGTGDFNWDSNTLVVDSSASRVGIGTDNPDGQLHVHTATAGNVTAAAAADDLVIENSDDTGISLLTPDDKAASIYFGNPSDNLAAYLQYDYGTNALYFSTHRASAKMYFNTATATTAMTIDASQNVGIGIAPNAVNKLQIKQASNINLGVRGAVDVSGAVCIQAVNDAVDSNIPLEYRASKHSFSYGNVGIGTAAPKSLLQVDGENAAGVITISHGGASNSISDNEILGTIDFAGYDLTNTYAVGAKISTTAAGNWADASTNYAGTDLEFYTQDDTTTDTLTSPRMVINKDGNVGIGITNPGAKLSILGPNATGTFFYAQNDGAAGAEFKRVNASSSPYNHFLFHNGNVGIGTDDPSRLLTLNSTGQADLAIRSADGNWAQLLFGDQTADNMAGVLYDNDSGKLHLNTSTTGSSGIRLTIDNSGKVGIGQDSDGAQLEVDGIGRFTSDAGGWGDGGWAMEIGRDNTYGYLGSYDRGATTYKPMYLFASKIILNGGGEGFVLIGKTSTSATVDGTSIGTPASGITSTYSSTNHNTYHVYRSGATDPGYKFYVNFNGTINSTSTSISALSDIRLKENIVDLETGLSEVMALKPRRFDWKEGENKNVAGFIAQEVETVLPELIGDFKHDEIDDCKSLKMGDMLPTLVKAIQELSASNDDLKSRIEALENA